MMKEERSDVRLMIEPVLSNVELEHDFLWRVHQATPAKGMIGIWNRSHYEDVLIARVVPLIRFEGSYDPIIWGARSQRCA